MKRLPASSPRSSRGATLIVALVLLIVVTLLGVASLRGVILQEKMASSQYDRSLAFQSAEAALREGELAAVGQAQANPTNKDIPAFTDPDVNACNKAPCVNGLCATPDSACEASWDMHADGDWANATASLGDLAGSAPQYLVEYLGIGYSCDPGNTYAAMACKLYRITARSRASAERAQVILQTIVTTP